MQDISTKPESRENTNEDLINRFLLALDPAIPRKHRTTLKINVRKTTETCWLCSFPCHLQLQNIAL